MAITMEALVTRVPATEKTEFQRLCEQIGTTPAGALRIFVTCFNNNGGFPFEVKTTSATSFDASNIAYSKPQRDKNGVIGFPADDYNDQDDAYDLLG